MMKLQLVATADLFQGLENQQFQLQFVKNKFIPKFLQGHRLIGEWIKVNINVNGSSLSPILRSHIKKPPGDPLRTTEAAVETR